jgi:hypothetical protein
MPGMGFEPTIPVFEQAKTVPVNYSASSILKYHFYHADNKNKI